MNLGLKNPRIEVPASSSDSYCPIMDGDELDEVDQRATDQALANCCTCQDAPTF
jgi:hypothetical protein